jgi:TrpR-related protein YerC/YecD
MVKDPELTQLKKQTQTLCNAFLFLQNANEIFDFLRDLLTAEEMKEFQQRMDIAVRLHYKKPYTEIEKELSVSSTTIARVSKYLK